MNGIYHKIGIRANTAEVVKALTTQAGLADRVTWECTSGPDDWIGSHVDFDLKPAAVSRLRMMLRLMI